MESPDSASYNASCKLLDSPSGEKLNQIVRQFTNAQELAYLQSDIFGFSPPPYSSAPATLTLPSFLEPYSDFDGITNKATPSRKRSFSSISEPLFSAKEGSEPFAAPATPAPAAPATPAASSANKRRKQSAAAAAAESTEKKSDKSEAKLNHTRSERERRQKMNDSIEQLRKLLPNQCQEVANNKLTILQESAGYIRHLKDSIVLCQAEVQRSDESYRRLWDEYRRLRHLLSLYSFPDPHHQMQPCPLPPFHIMPLDPLARQPSSSSFLFGPGGEEANNQCLNAAYHFQQSLASPSQSLPACAVCTSPTCADASHAAGSPSSGTPEPSPK